MRVAFVSYEYAGVGHGGGIGTYVRNAAAMLAARGSTVEVFTGAAGDGAAPIPNVRVHVVPGAREGFATGVLATFSARHSAAPFDIVEAAEYGADLADIADAHPDLPRLVKLHTPSFLISRMNDDYLTWRAKARYLLGALRRGRIPRPFWGRYDEGGDVERRVALGADELTSPSRALVEIVRRTWPIDLARTSVVPNVYEAEPSLVALDPARVSSLVTFIGKLEVRKGVIELARAIPAILKAVPSARFRFVGRALPHPATGEPLDAVIRRLAHRAADRIEFAGAVPYSRIPHILSDTAIAVFPSYWETIGYVCLEAMAAGCGIVASNAGGGPEIVDDGRTGILVPPRHPEAIAAAVIALLRDPIRRATMGRAAREQVLSTYAPAVIGPLQEAAYARAIAHARPRTAASARLRVRHSG